jgi:hypothetical protein
MRAVLAAVLALASAPGGFTAADRHYETLRAGLQNLFYELGIQTQPAAV